MDDTLKFTNLISIMILAIYLSSSLTGLCLVFAQEDSLNEGRQQLIEAFKAVSEAESKGANIAQVQLLAAKLNEANNLLDEAEKLSYGEKAVQLAQSSIELSREVKAEAELAMEKGVQNTFNSKVISWSLVVIASFITSFMIMWGHTWYIMREETKLLAMTIRRKKKKGRS